MDRKPVTVRSYANIAIIKYWGKKAEKEMVPATSSISLTLENMYTETTLSPLPADATADALVETALEHGALGAKMSGGGLGGCIIALVADYHQAQNLAERLEEKGAVQTWIESL